MYSYVVYNIVSLCIIYMPEERFHYRIWSRSGSYPIGKFHELLRSCCYFVFLDFLFHGVVYFVNLINGYFLVF